MPEILIQRVGYFDNCTLGYLSAGPLQLVTLEPRWEDNFKGTSCIPAGVYKLGHYMSPSKGEVLRVFDVPAREDIELHAGNFISETEGCVLVGASFGHDGEEFKLNVSARSLRQLIGWFCAQQGAELRIVNKAALQIPG